jgi:ABC-type transport system involved in cytochrome c biogenesis permease component
MLLGMPERENIDMILLYVAILLACLLGLSFEFWKVNQFGQWEPLKLTVVAVGLVISGTFLVMELRKPKS